MLPHEVLISQELLENHANIRPHSRVVTPTSRASGKAAAAIRTQEQQQRILEYKGPFISKAQLMRHAYASSNATQAGTVNKSLVLHAQGGTLLVTRTNSPPSTTGGPIARTPPLSSKKISPHRPATHDVHLINSAPLSEVHPEFGPLRTSPQRTVGKVIVNPNTVLPICVKSRWIGPENSLTDEVVQPGSTHHQLLAPDRSGYISSHIVSSTAVGGSHPNHAISSVVKMTTPGIMTVTVTTPHSRHKLHRAAIGGSTSTPIGDIDVSTSLVCGTASSVVLAPLRCAYGLTENDCVQKEQQVNSVFSLQNNCHFNGDHALINSEGLMLKELIPSETVQVNLKSLLLATDVPHNTFLTIRPPKMKVNPGLFIPTPVSFKSQTSIHSTNAIPTTAQHLFIDFSGWTNAHLAPVIRLPNAFLYDVTPEEHLIDRSLGYILHISKPEMFLMQTPRITEDTNNLVLIPNPNLCGASIINVQLADYACVDLSTGDISKSDEVVICVHVLKNTTISTTGKEWKGDFFTALLASLAEVDRGKILYCVDGDENIPIDADSIIGGGSIEGIEKRAITVAEKRDNVANGLGNVNMALVEHNRSDGNANNSTILDEATQEALQAPYSFPLPDVHSLREDAILRNEVEMVQRFFKFGGKDIHSGSDEEGGMITNESSNLRNMPLPFDAALHPYFISCLTAFEAARLPFTSLELKRLTTLSIVGDVTEQELLSDVAAIEKTDPLGALSDKLCPILTNLAKLYVAQGSCRQGDALETFERVARIIAVQLGFDTMADVGVKTPILALIDEVSRNKISLAEEMLMINEKVELLIQSLERAATYLKILGRYEEAMDLYVIAHKAAEQYIGHDSLTTLRCSAYIAEIYALRGDFNKAIKLYDSAVGVAELLCGIENDITIQMLRLLGNCFQHQADYTNALACHNRVLRCARNSLTVQLTADSSSSAITRDLLKAHLDVAEAQSFVAYALALSNNGHVPVRGGDDAVAENMIATEELLTQISLIRLSDNGFVDDNPSLSEAPNEDMVIAMVYYRLSMIAMLRGETSCVELMQQSKNASLRSCNGQAIAVVIANDDSVPTDVASTPLKCFEAAIASVNIVALRIYVNRMFHKDNVTSLECARDVLCAILGNRHPAYCRAVILYSQLLRTTHTTKAIVMSNKAIASLRKTLMPYHIDMPVCDGILALNALKESSLSSAGPSRTALRQRSLWYVNDAVNSISIIKATLNISREHGVDKYSLAEFVLHRVVLPLLLTVYNATNTAPPSVVLKHLEEHVQKIRECYGETSLQLIEPYQNLGECHYLLEDYVTAHHFFSRALKVADTINFIFPLGQLFKPAAHLTHSEVQERNRIASDRLQPHQALQFAAVLYAIAGVYTAQNKADEAQSTYLQAQAALEMGHAYLSTGTVLVLQSMAQLLYFEGHYGDAFAHAQKADTLLVDHHISIGSTCPNMSSSTSEVGVMLRKNVQETLMVIESRLRRKGYTLCRQYDNRHRFVVYL